MMLNAIAWRLDAHKYDDIHFPIIILLITLIGLVVQRLALPALNRKT